MDEKVAPKAEEGTAVDAKVLEDLKAELAKLREENSKLMNAQSSASADASKYKKALQERMSEQERAATETKELIDRLKAENAEMRRNQTMAEHTSGFLGLGFDEALARKAAEATSEGNFSALIGAMKDFIITHDKALQADALRNTPRPGVGSVTPAITKEQFDNMGYAERLKLHNEQPEVYKQMIE